MIATLPTPASTRWRRCTFAVGAPSALLAGAIALAVYANSGPVQWMDNGEFLWSAASGIYVWPDLGALSHPLFRLVSAALVATFGIAALPLLNALLLVPCAALVARIVRVLDGTRAAALCAACTLCLTHCVFWVATKVEVYALHLLLVLGCYWLALDHELRIHANARIFGLAILTGLALSVHQLTLVCLGPILLCALWWYRPSVLVVVAGALVGLAPCYPGALAQLHRGRDLLDVAREFLTAGTATGTGYEHNVFRFDRLWASKSFVAIALLSLCGPQVVGLLYPRGARERAMWWAAILNLGFVLSYDVPDRFTFFLPGAALLSILAWLRIDDRVQLRGARLALALTAICALPATLTIAAGAAARGLIHLPSNAHGLPFRDDVQYFMAPYLRDDSALRFARAYERQVPHGAAVFADWTPFGALEAAQAGGTFAGRELHTCEEYADWAVHNPGRSAYVVRFHLGCEALAGKRVRALPIGFRVDSGCAL